VMSFQSRSGAFATVESDLGNGHYYDARYGDGEVTLVVHDETPPTNPARVYSDPHEPHVWSAYANVSISHYDAADDLSGVDGFSYLWDTNPQGEPDFVKDAEETENPITSTVSDGDANYFHLRTVDNAGNWSEDVLTLGPFLIDTTPPTAPRIKPGEIDLAYQRDIRIALSWTRPGDAGSGLYTNPTYWVYVKETKRDEPWIEHTGAIGSLDESLSYQGRPGFNYCFSVQAQDNVENRVLGQERCTAVPLDDRQLTERGAWADLRGSGYYLGTYSRTSRRGAALETGDIRASRLALVATRCPGCGRVRVSLAGRLLKEINLNATVVRKKQFIAVATFDRPRTGKLRIAVASSGKPVKVEGFAVLRAPGR
jgi:hypothetical protein